MKYKTDTLIWYVFRGTTKRGKYGMSLIIKLQHAGGGSYGLYSGGQQYSQNIQGRDEWFFFNGTIIQSQHAMGRVVWLFFFSME